MKKSFEVLNIRCEGCANTIDKKLRDKFPDIKIDLGCEPRIVTVDIKSEEDEEFLKETLRTLGYPLKDDKKDLLSSTGMFAKSLVSCAVGKITLEKKVPNQTKE
ncbi:heavy-metal-associated domain-containing protein [Nitrosophilus alvini]|uniref:heavy-metal-associated domain-containing protein n=1 Tax=Nitrosophilus alvini TaxID=2714855 RepID=UPI00190CCE7E|nr:heavy metal transporter [Nitrosophilus alvini]